MNCLSASSSAKPKIRSTEELRSELLKSSPPPPATPAEWDENRLETDVLYRGQYLADFINFGKVRSRLIAIIIIIIIRRSQC
jgi:hypothetical protein